MRAATSLVLAIGLAACLAACSSGPAAPTGCDATPSGSASDSVKVSGAADAAPTVTVSGLTVPASTQRTVITEGSGTPVASGDDVTVEYTIVSALTGDVVDQTKYDGTNPATFSLDGSLIPGFEKVLVCSTPGSRVVGVLSADDGLSSDQLSKLGLAAGDSLVLVLDVKDVSTPEPPLSRAEGEAQPAPEGFPTVVLGSDGRPEITIPDAAPPTDLKIATLIQGDGAEVQDGAQVTVHYVGINWNTKQIFDESWARGEPSTFTTGGVIDGFAKALIGQKVGSQVIAIIPPAEGYGSAGSPPNIGGTDTIVFVVDILATK